MLSEHDLEEYNRMVDEDDTEDDVLVFVYGTLKDGGSLNWHLSMATGSDFIGSALVSGYKLKDLGAFPGMVTGDETDSVLGEVWLTDKINLPYLDTIEGCPHLYTRENVNVKLAEENSVEFICNAYVLCRDDTYGVLRDSAGRLFEGGDSRLVVTPDYNNESTVYWWDNTRGSYGLFSQTGSDQGSEEACSDSATG